MTKENEGKTEKTLSEGEQKKELNRMEKLTITKLREEAKTKYPELEGVSGMKKDDLVHAICKIIGIDYETRKKKGKEDIKKKLKKGLKKLRAQKEEIKGREFRKQRNIMRKKIKKTKRSICKAA